MDINLLVLNVGNSRVGVGGFVAGGVGVAGELEHSVRLSLENRADWEGKIADGWGRIRGRENSAVAGASVNPAVEAELEKIVKRVAERPVEWVGKQIDLPIKVLTENPEETGVDRIV